MDAMGARGRAAGRRVSAALWAAASLVACATGPPQAGPDGGARPTDGGAARHDLLDDGALDTADGDAQVRAVACPGARLVDALPFRYVGTTAGRADHFAARGDACAVGLGQPRGGGDLAPGQGHPDEAFAFTPTATGVYSLGLRHVLPGGRPTILYVLAGCATAEPACVAYSGDLSSAEVFPVRLEAGQTYTVVVDGLRGGGVEPSDEGDYELTISPPCAETCGDNPCAPGGCGLLCGACDRDGAGTPAETCTPLPGDTCASPLELAHVQERPATPFRAWEGRGDLSARHGSFSVDAAGLQGGTCGDSAAPPLPSAAPDMVFWFQAGEEGSYTFQLDGAEHPVGWRLYITNVCGDVDGPCVGASSAADPTRRALAAHHLPTSPLDSSPAFGLRPAHSPLDNSSLADARIGVAHTAHRLGDG